MALTMNHSQLSFAHFPISEGEAAKASKKPVLELIAGDASDRKFYRLRNADFSAICMRFPKWDGGYGGDPLSWLGMHKAFAAMGIPVPEVLKIDPDAACIWTEDFGDNFLNYKLGHATLDASKPACDETLDYYRQAIDLLVLAQYPARPVAEHPALTRAFDFEKLMFEMDFFLKHFVEGFLQLSLADGKNFAFSKVRSDLENLCTILDGRERVLTHRDYHVRNVMIVDGTAKWIDFQDARMGPHTYDVVSLLRDSYTKIEKDTRAELSQYYFDAMNKARARLAKPAMDKGEYQREFALMGLQRNIKAIGSFGYLASLKGKPSYLRYVRHTMSTILSDESRLAGTGDLGKEFPAIHGFLQDILEGPLKQRFADRLDHYKVNDSF